MLQGIKIHDLTGVDGAILRFSVRVGESELSGAKKDRDGRGVAVHHRFLFGAVLDSQHSHLFILQLDSIMLRIGLHWIVGGRLGRSLHGHRRFLLFWMERDYAHPRAMTIP